jgi:Tol biopolymer transport system component/tRNA A-37 threonylcarbamoyl transferase component Bud32
LSEASTRLSAALADRYRIERELGAGGMATVYLAEDLKHRRKVALKVLRPELAAVIGAQRFLAEITTTANLQHPHILPLHDSGTVDGTVFYVMPFVEGESLRDRIHREKQLPLADAVRIARDVADALDYAHRHGVIHRDIKPDNVLLHDGRAVVADFGIALAASRTEGGARITETGMSLGTPHYMSPEQAMGEHDLDGRTDVYALGCVVHEMLAGEPPFTGPTAQAIVAKVMAGEPPALSTLRRTVPEHVEDAVLTALQKIPADRFTTAGAFATALEGKPDATAPHTRRTRAPAASSRRRPWLWPAVAVVLGFFALGGWIRPWLATPAVDSTPPTQLALLLPDIGGASTGTQRQIEITPDGTALLYVGFSDGQARTMRIGLDGSEPRVLDGVEPNLADYSIAPDGRSFTAGSHETGAIFRYPIGGGSGKALPRQVSFGQRGAWASDGSYWLSSYSSGNIRLMRVSADDSVSQPLGLKNADVYITQILPGDRMALGVRQPMGSSTGPLVLLDLRTGDARTISEDAVVEARYTVGYLVYVLGDGSLQAAPFDLKAQRLTAPPVTLATGVTLTGGGQAQFAVADNGTVAFVVEAGRSLVVADRTGAGKPLLTEMRSYHSPRFSPDGKRISLDFTGPEGRDVWILALADNALTRATFDRDGHDASWSRDGRSLAYTSFHNSVLGVNRIRPGSTQTGDSLLTSTHLAYTGIWLHNDSALVTVGQSLQGESSLDIALVRNGGRGPIVPIVATRFAEQYPSVSPDDQWLAFSSNQSGREEVYVRRLDGTGDQIQVSVGGGTESAWSPDGKELYYRGGVSSESRAEPAMVVATIATTPALAVTSRKALFPAQGIASVPHSNFDVSPDGKSFVFVRSNPSSRVMVIQNLAAMVERRRVGGRTP